MEHDLNSKHRYMVLDPVTNVVVNTIYSNYEELIIDDDWVQIPDGLNYDPIALEYNSEDKTFSEPRPTAQNVREKRDELLREVVDPIVTNTLRWSDLAEEKQNEWAAYRRSLLDITETSGFPDNVNWPTKPS